MTQGNQTYSVLTKKMVPGFEYLGRAAIFIWAFVWSVVCVAEFFEGQDSRDATAINALTYEDGLALANKRLRPLPKEGREWVEAMAEIAYRESRFNPNAKNPKSSARGLYQFLDSTASNYGGRKKDPLDQTRQATKYVTDRYGSAQDALDFHKQNGHY